MWRGGRGAIFALPFLLTLLACPRAPESATDPRAPCASLDHAACERARALVAAAATYADEVHDYVLASPGVSPAGALSRTKDGWRPLPLACARARAPAPHLDTGVVDYAFVGVAVDSTLVSADADIGPLLARPEPRAHDVWLVAIAFARDLAPPSFDRGEALLEAPSGGCTCGEASHFVGAPKYGALLAYSFRASRAGPHVRALDFVRAALGDARRSVRESRVGGMTIDGLAQLLSRDATVPLTFRLTDAQPIAFEAAPIAELCDFPAPEVSPSPLDFGVAPYGTEARRTVHVVNRAPIDLRAIVGASTFVLPASGAIDIPLHWTPDGDAPGCETQTRDEAIPFLRSGGGTPRAARVLETIRTGRPTVERTERIAADAPSVERDWTCPRDFVRTSCRADAVADGTSAPEARRGPHEVVGPHPEVTAEPRGDNACHFACRGVSAPGHPPSCRFDATMQCALHCPP